MPNYFVALRELEVSRVATVAGGIRRVTLTGEQLGEFTRDGVACPAFATGAFDDHVRVFPPAEGEVVLPVQRQGHLEWPDDPPALTRDYSVRRYDPIAGELDLEVVTRHDGPGARWAATAGVGDRIHIAGPRTSTSHPIDTAGYVLIGDDASLPPIARYLDTRPDHLDVTIVAVVDRDNAGYPLPPGTTLIVRDTPAADPDELFDHVRKTVVEHPDAYVWAALELHTARRLRGLLQQIGFPRARRFVTHYWRRGALAESDHKRAAHHRLEPMIDLLTPMVLRVAVTVGLLDAVYGGANTPATAAAATRCDPGAVTTLLTFLTRRGLMHRLPDGTFAVTELGEHLLDEDGNYLASFLHLDRTSGHMASALPGLLHATRTGASGYEQVHGRSFWDALSADDVLGADFDDRLSAWADEWVPTVVEHQACARATSIIDIGGGTGMLAAALARAHPHAAVTVVELEGPARRARAALAGYGLAERVAVTEGSFFDPLPAGHSVYVVAQVLHDWPDVDARRILRRCAEALPETGRLLVVERLVDDNAADTDDDHAEMGVLMLALFGAKERTLAGYTALLGDAGLEVLDVVRAGGPLGVIEARRSAGHDVQASIRSPS